MQVGAKLRLGAASGVWAGLLLTAMACSITAACACGTCPDPPGWDAGAPVWGTSYTQNLCAGASLDVCLQGISDDLCQLNSELHGERVVTSIDWGTPTGDLDVVHVTAGGTCATASVDCGEEATQGSSSVECTIHTSGPAGDRDFPLTLTFTLQAP